MASGGGPRSWQPISVSCALILRLSTRSCSNCFTCNYSADYSFYSVGSVAWSYQLNSWFGTHGRGGGHFKMSNPGHRIILFLLKVYFAFYTNCVEKRYCLHEGEQIQQSNYFSHSRGMCGSSYGRRSLMSVTFRGDDVTWGTNCLTEHLKLQKQDIVRSNLKGQLWDCGWDTVIWAQIRGTSTWKSPDEFVADSRATGIWERTWVNCSVFRVQIRQADTKRMWPGDKNRLVPEGKEKLLTPGCGAKTIHRHGLIYTAYVTCLIIVNLCNLTGCLGSPSYRLDAEFSCGFSITLLGGAV